MSKSGHQKGQIRWDIDPCTAEMIVLNFSGGAQSTCILAMVALGDLNPCRPFYVLNADPGMEAKSTYHHIDIWRELAARKNVVIETVPGPNLYDDIVNLPGHATRLDTPAYYVRKPDGSRGKLRQKCTAHYKIAPMDRAIRRIMARDFGVPLKTSKIPRGFVEKWIGFTKDEVHRVKPPEQRYIAFRFPLIDMGMTKADTAAWFNDHNMAIPPRSVCNGCFAHSPRELKEMHDTRPDDWAQAVAVDNAIRDWSRLGVLHPVYVSDTLLPLEALARRGFKVDDEDKPRESCDSGYCFT